MTRIRQPRLTLLVGALLAAGVAAFLLSLIAGRGGMPTSHAVDALMGHPVRRYEAMIMEMRVPRATGAALAGAALAVSGALLQCATGNPLAEPGMLGISNGAVLGVVLSSWTGLGLPGGVPSTAFVGALVAPVLIGVSLGRRWNSPRDLALTGVLVGMLLAALASGVLVLSGQTMGVVVRWLVGSLNAATWSDLTAMWPAAVIGVLLMAALARPLQVMALGDQRATTLGAKPAAVRAGALATAVVLTSAAVVIAGALPFLGLAVPHLAKRLAGGNPVILLPLSALLGSTLLLVADSAAMSLTLSLPGVGSIAGLPVGAVIAPLAGPYLLVLLRKNTRPRATA